MKLISKLLLSLALPVAAAVAYVPAAHADVVVYPSRAYVASYRPVFYNGCAHYLWNGQWYYADRVGAWHTYGVREEPVVLQGERVGWVQRRVIIR
jgi:hypothetical protein